MGCLRGEASRAGVAEGSDGRGVGGDDPVHDSPLPGAVGRLLPMVAGGVHGQQAEQPARNPPHARMRLAWPGLLTEPEPVKHWPGRVVPEPLKDLVQHGLGCPALVRTQAEVARGAQRLVEGADPVGEGGRGEGGKPQGGDLVVAEEDGVAAALVDVVDDDGTFTGLADQFLGGWRVKETSESPLRADLLK